MCIRIKTVSFYLQFNYNYVVAWFSIKTLSSSINRSHFHPFSISFYKIIIFSFFFNLIFNSNSRNPFNNGLAASFFFWPLIVLVWLMRMRCLLNDSQKIFNYKQTKIIKIFIIHIWLMIKNRSVNSYSLVLY